MNRHRSRGENQPKFDLQIMTPDQVSGSKFVPKGECCQRGKMALSAIGVACLLVAYTLLCALVFNSLENAGSSTTTTASSTTTTFVSLGVQEQDDEAARALRLETVEHLWKITEELNILYKENWTSLADREMRRFQRELLYVTGNGGGGGGPQQSRNSNNNNKFRPSASVSSDSEVTTASRTDHEEWTFSSSFLFALSLITTVGYKRPSPASSVEKLVAVVCAMIGGPILLMYLSTVGSLMASAFKKALFVFWRNWVCRKKKYSGGNEEVPDEGGENIDYFQRGRRGRAADLSSCRRCLLEQVKCRRMGGHKALVRSRKSRLDPHVIWLCLILLFVYIFCGAFVLSTAEGWNFIDSFYFCFAALFTIGLDARHGGRHSASFVPLVTLYLLFGLGLVAMCVNIIFTLGEEIEEESLTDLEEEGDQEDEEEEVLRIRKKHKRGS